MGITKSRYGGIINLNLGDHKNTHIGRSQHGYTCTFDVRMTEPLIGITLDVHGKFETGIPGILSFEIGILSYMLRSLQPALIVTPIYVKMYIC